MAIKLVFLGRLADMAGHEMRVEAGPPAAILASLPPELAVAVTSERVRWALNGALLARDDLPELVDGDELAFLPPVSGG